MGKLTSGLPTGDIGVEPTWAGSANGVPSLTSATWTASAFSIDPPEPLYYWVWSGTNIGIYGGGSYDSISVRCVLPANRLRQKYLW